MKFTGTSGQDVFDGTGEADKISGLGGNDILHGGGGVDTINGGGGNDTIGGGIGFDVLDGGAGVDLYDLTEFASLNDAVIDLAAGTYVDGGGTEIVLNFENVMGTGGRQTILGSAGANVLDGGTGEDHLDGRDGNDILSGGSGVFRDLLIGGLGHNIVDGEFGEDTSSYADIGSAVVVDLVLGTATFTGGSDQLISIEDIDGSAFDDVIAGDGFDNVLVGGDGDDTIDGGGGTEDVIFAGAGDDHISQDEGFAVIFGGAGNDTIVTNTACQLNGDKGDDLILASNENDTIKGGGGADSIDGFGSSDRIWGENGSDSIDGGVGADTLTGGAGKDHFIYDNLADSNDAFTDLITDLADEDRIDLSAIDANDAKDGDQAFKLVAEFTNHAGEAVLSYAVDFDTTFLSADVNGDGVADLTVSMDGDHTGFTNFVL